MKNISIFSDELPDAYKNDLSYRQAIGFLSLAQVTDTLVNVQKGTLSEKDFEIRDVLFQNKLPHEEIPDYYDYIGKHYAHKKSHDQASYLQNLRETCQLMKFRFWKKYSTTSPTTNEILETKRIVRQVNSHFKSQSLNFHRLSALALFSLVALGASYMMKLHLNQIRIPMVFFGITVLFSAAFTQFRFSNEIFNDIPPLPWQEAEMERQQIINYCYSLDVDLVSKYMLYEDNLKKRIEELRD